jgi:hypothetical protein
VSAAADDARVAEARRRLAALPHDTELVGLGQAELVAWVARMHGAAQLLDAFVRVTGVPGDPTEDTRPAVREAARRGARKAAALAEHEAEDMRRLDRIRDVPRHFDWEYHDRQLALEAIERIADGGQA